MSNGTLVCRVRLQQIDHECIVFRLNRNILFGYVVGIVRQVVILY